jgi:uncharacterized membrane protein YfcA
MDPAVAIWAPLGVLVGAWSGLSGYSGWPLVVPILLVVARVPVYEALAVSMGVDALNAIGAGTVYLARGDSDVGLGVRLAAGAAPAALAGAGIAFLVLEGVSDLLQGSAGWVAIALGSLLVMRALHLPALAPAGGAPAPGRAALAAAASPSPRARRAAHVGAVATAFLIGLVGMGGGFQMALVAMFVLGFPGRRAVGTALLFSALTLPVALLAYLAFLGFAVEAWRGVAPFALGSVAGAVLAAGFAGRLPERGLGVAMGACVVSAGMAATAQHWLLG